MDLILEVWDLELDGEGSLIGYFEGEHGESFIYGDVLVEVHLIALEEIFGSDRLLYICKGVLIVGKREVSCTLGTVLKDVREMRKHINLYVVC